VNPLEALAHLPQQQLLAGQVAGWRCGRAFEADAGLSNQLPADQSVAVLAPDGSLAGMARALEGGLLQPKLVFDAAG
jgi:tRNA pseudouridine55 synthase